VGFGLNVIKALSQDSLCLIKDIIANPHPTTPYEILKDMLLNNNSLTNSRTSRVSSRWERSGPSRSLQSCWPTPELTPADELESKYLIFLFIQRLPKILRMQLGDDLDHDLRDISERAEPPVVYSRPRHGALSSHGGHSGADGWEEWPGWRACGRHCPLSQEEAAQRPQL
jgi:hypothetical protein